MEGRDTAIPRLLEQHGGRLYGLGLRLCGAPEEAEDLVQETFLQAYRSWDQFEGRSKPSTWLFTIASRVCQRMHRRRAGQPEKMESLDELAPFLDKEIAVPPDGPLDAQIRKEGLARVEEAITNLPIDFRMPLILKDIVGFSVAEVASVLGLEEATVKTRVHRARLRLRAELTKGFESRALPPPAYGKQVCLDLLEAKQEALDRGVEFPQEVICDRCRAVFASLDLTGDICAALGRGEMPSGLEKRLLEQIS